jgi:hypothetical protein
MKNQSKITGLDRIDQAYSDVKDFVLDTLQLFMLIGQIANRSSGAGKRPVPAALLRIGGALDTAYEKSSQFACAALHAIVDAALILTVIICGGLFGLALLVTTGNCGVTGALTEKTTSRLALRFGSLKDKLYAKLKLA